MQGIIELFQERSSKLSNGSEWNPLVLIDEVDIIKRRISAQALLETLEPWIISCVNVLTMYLYRKSSHALPSTPLISGRWY